MECPATKLCKCRSKTKEDLYLRYQKYDVSGCRNYSELDVAEKRHTRIIRRFKYLVFVQPDNYLTAHVGIEFSVSIKNN